MVELSDGLCLMVWARATTCFKHPCFKQLRATTVFQASLSTFLQGKEIDTYFEIPSAYINLVLRQTRRHLRMSVWRHNRRPLKHVGYQLFSNKMTALFPQTHSWQTFLLLCVSVRVRECSGRHRRSRSIEENWDSEINRTQPSVALRDRIAIPEPHWEILLWIFALET